MWPFKKDKIIVPTIANKDDLVELIEIFRQGSPLSDMMEGEIKKQVISGYEFTPFDESSHFNRDFDVQPTITRLKTAYAQEPWMFACVQVIARALSTVNFVVKNSQTDEIDWEHPLNRIIRAGNSLQDSHSLEWAGHSDLIISGNFFRVYDSSYSSSMHVPVENVNIVFDDKGFPTGIDIINPKTQTKEFIPANNVIHFKLANPFSPTWGMSPFTALARPILLDRYKSEFETAFYLRGCAKAGVIETDAEYSKTKMARLMTTFEQVFTGKRNWWRPLFLPKGAKWIANASTLSEMQHLEGLRENRRTILGVMGIPPSQVGIVEDVNRSTSETQQAVFYENTIKPYARFIASTWNNSFIVRKMFNSRVYIDCDYSDVPALQESLKAKGEQAESMKSFFTINEIRKRVFDADPLPDGRGDMFVAEISRRTPGGLPTDLVLPEPKEDIGRQNLLMPTSTIKEAVVRDQERVEKSLSSKLKKVIDEYIDTLLKFASYALRNGIDPKLYLAQKTNDLKDVYEKQAVPLLIRAMERGFTFSTERLKNLSPSTKAASPIDRQAIEYLREETREGKRRTLTDRAINNFLGFTQTRSNEILDIIASSFEAGATADQTAGLLREAYGEKYGEQAFTITRTEILTAISQGIKWNQEVLQEVFTEVKKQWFHVGDIATNPDARELHAKFEEMGEQPVDFVYEGGLRYPRDPNGEAGDIINCRCTLVNIIPESAESNAESILLRD